jgi:hypothetical protein
VHWVVQLSMGNKNEIGVIWALFFLFFWAIFVIDPHVYVYVSVNLLLIEELDFESSVSKPFQVNFSLELLKL